MTANTLPLSGQAVVYAGRGGYEVIAVEQRQTRPPARGEVRIRVHAAAVNPTDLLLRAAPEDGPPTSIIPGMDAAGVIESVGPDVSRFQPGDAVMAAVMPRRPEGGAQTQYLVLPAASVVAVPVGVTLAQAATLPMNGLTALRALDLVGLQAGQFLAISGGSGLLAQYALALARRAGIKTIADAKPEDAARVRGYGADIVIERGPGFADAVRRELPQGAHALLDTAVLGEAAFGALQDGGVYVPVRGWAGPVAPRGIRIQPVFVFEVLQRTEWLEQLRQAVEAGDLSLRVAGEYPPAQAAQAQRALAAGGLTGRPVIVFNGQAAHHTGRGGAPR